MHKAFEITLTWVVWMATLVMLYLPDWLNIPLINDLFGGTGLPLPNGNLTYTQLITSYAIISFVLLAFVSAIAAARAESENRGLHR